MPTGAWTATTKVAFKGTPAVPPGRHHPAWRRRQPRQVRPHRRRRRRRGEVRVHPGDQRGRAQRRGRLDGERAGELPERLLPADGLRRDQRHRRVLDRRHDVDPGRPPGGDPGEREDRRVRVQQRRDRRRRSRTSTGSGSRVRPVPAGPSRDDDFSGDSLDKSRWNAIVRDNPAKYTVGSGNLTITTELGDIYTADTNPPPNNFILQSADHAGADWVIETKLSGNITDGYGQGGLIAYGNGDNYVKLDAISDQRPDADQPHRAALGGRRPRSRTRSRSCRRARGHGEHLAAPDQDGHELQGRVLVRRHGLDGVRRDGGRTRWPRRRSACSPSGRRRRRSATRCRSTTSPSTARTRRRWVRLHRPGRRARRPAGHVEVERDRAAR